MDETLSWEDGSYSVFETDYYLEWDANDKNILYLTLKKDFLERLDGTGTKISPSLTLTEPKSGRTFGTYSVPALVNSAPPAVILPVVLRTDGDAGDETYVICFNLPEMTGIHRDVKTLKIGSPYEKTYTITPDGNLSGGEAELTEIYGDTWKPVTENGAEFVGDINNRFVGIVTNVPLSGDLTSFTLSLVDEYGLSTSVTASTQASKLPSVTASPTGGIITINGTVVFSNLVPGATLVLESNNWEGVEYNGTPVSGNIEGAGPITLTFTKPRTYNITAYAQKSGAADSDKVTFTYTVPEPSSVTITIPDLEDVTLSATVSDGTVTINGVPGDATVTGAYIHGIGLKKGSEDNTFNLNPGTPFGTYPLTVVIEYKGIAYSAVVYMEVE